MAHLTALVPYSASVAEAGVAKLRYEKEKDYIATFKALHCGAEATTESKLIRSIVTIFPTTHTEQEMKSRIDGYEKASRFLESLTDAELKEFLGGSTTIGSGTGGEVFSSNIDGLPVFIKKIRLTDLEKKHPRATENLFELPSCYQYGVGSQGFGVWREIASHEMTTKWVLEGECQNFPLMYHFRVLERENLTQQKLSLEEREEIDSMFQYWDQSKAVKEKLMAARQAQADIVVVMESLPQTLNTWMKSPENLSKLKQLECELNLVIAFMQSKGFLHLDAHFHNILSNNDHPYFADFGLALSKEFELSPQEKAFFETHKDYDRSYVAGALALETLALCAGERFEEEQDLYLSSGKTKIQLPLEAHEITARYQKFAKIMGDFLKNLREQSKSTPYPEQELSKAWQEA